MVWAVQKRLDARRARTELRGVSVHTLSGAVCSATPAFAGVNSADACSAADERFVKPSAFSGREYFKHDCASLRECAPGQQHPINNSPPALHSKLADVCRPGIHLVAPLLHGHSHN
jgi:hypothetical protein